MFSNNVRKIVLFCCAFAVCSCSVFSDSKELPSGTRISILDSKKTSETAQGINVSQIPAVVTYNAWTQSGGNSNHFMGNISGSNDMKKSWTANFGKGSNKRDLLLAQPIIVNGLIYTQDIDATVSAFDINTGKKIFKKKIKPENTNVFDNGLNGVGLATDGDKVYAVTGYGSVLALDAKSGDELWHINTNSLIRISPNICSDKLIIQTLDNKLIVLNTVDGSEMFRYNTSAEDTVLAGGATPACSTENNIIIAGFSNGQIEAFNADIGYPLWNAPLLNVQRGNSTTNINAIKASPVIDNDVVYAIGNNDMMLALDYRTGETIWAQEIGSVNTPWVAGNYIYIISNAGELICLDKNTGDIIFTSKLLAEYSIDERTDIYLSGPVMVNGKLIISASNGMIYVVSPYDGSIENKIDTGNELPYAPISAQDAVVFVNSDAEITVYK